MSIRRNGKHARRSARALRKMLIHAAGCVVSDCASVGLTRADYDNSSPMRSVRVPRSLRARLGLTVGGHN